MRQPDAPSLLHLRGRGELGDGALLEETSP